MKITNLLILIVVGTLILIWGITLAKGAEISALQTLSLKQKTEISSLITKVEATQPLSYSEAIKYIKSLNDNTRTHTFSIKSGNDILKVLTNELKLNIK